MKLSKQVSDAIRILVTCYRSEGELLKVGHIAEELGLTKQIALKTANTLAQAGLLETVRGPSGGIRLADTARDVTIGQIVRVLEAVPQHASPQASGAGIGEFLDDAFAAFLEVLDRHKLSDLAAGSETARRKRRTTKRASGTKPASKALQARSAQARMVKRGAGETRRNT